MQALQESAIPYLVGGAYAFERYTGIARHTKDFDIFVRPADRDRTLAVLARAGFSTQIAFPHWLGKAYDGDEFIDVIYSSGNGIAEVDDGWFEHAVDGEVLDVEVQLCPAEEMIWQKAFIMERERYDGADVAHLLRARGPMLDWGRLLDRFGDHWRVLFSHLVLLGFIYPNEPSPIPDTVMLGLIRRLKQELGNRSGTPAVCQGTLLSRAQYLVDLDGWGYEDGRLPPHGTMTPEQRQRWTAAIAEDGEGLPDEPAT
jgi:hypothetical protein